jgi:hypothetical protein
MFAGRLTRYQAAFAGLFGLFVLVTNRWTGGGELHPGTGDVESYEKLAAAAPGLPGGPRLGNAYTERFVPHWIVGIFHDVTGIGLHTCYHLAAVLVTALLVSVAARILSTLLVSDWVYVVALGVFVLAAYSGIRKTVAEPGGVQDLTWILGAAIMLLGLVKVDLKLVLGGILLSIVSRQGTLIVAPTASVWILVGPGWRGLPKQRRIGYAVAASALCGVTYAVIKLITAHISEPYAPQSPGDTIFFTTPHLNELIPHFGRCAIVLVVALPMIVAVLGLLHSRGMDLRRLPPTMWLSLLAGAVIVAQPIVIRPDFPGFRYNEQRLAGMGILPIAVALALALDYAYRSGAIRAPSRGELAGICTLLGIASLHHVYTPFGPDNLKQFLALQVLAAVGVIAILGRLAFSRESARIRTASRPEVEPS